MSVDVLHQPAGATSACHIRLNHPDPFEVLTFVFAWNKPDADMRPDAQLPAWDAYQRRLMREQRQQKLGVRA